MIGLIWSFWTHLGNMMALPLVRIKPSGKGGTQKTQQGKNKHSCVNIELNLCLVKRIPVARNRQKTFLTNIFL